MINHQLCVIDCGACDWGEEESIEKLRLRFHPQTIIALDPAPAASPFWEEKRDGTLISFRRAAAWTHDNGAWLVGEGTTAHIKEEFEPGATKVATVDLVKEIQLARWNHQDVIVKLDVEGAEYRLLDYLFESHEMEQPGLNSVLVEWHYGPGIRSEYQPYSVPVWAQHKIRRWT